MLRNVQFCQQGFVLAHSVRYVFPVRGARGLRLQGRVSLTDALEFSEQQRWQEAADAWQQLLAKDSLPSDLRPQAECALGDALLKLGQDELALRHFYRATQGQGVTFAPGWLRLANAWRRLGGFGRAEEAYRRVLRKPTRRSGGQEDVSRAVVGAAVMMLRQGKLSKMKRLLETWTSMRPEDPRAAQNFLLLLGFLDPCF